MLYYIFTTREHYSFKIFLLNTILKLYLFQPSFELNPIWQGWRNSKLKKQKFYTGTSASLSYDKAEKHQYGICICIFICICVWTLTQWQQMFSNIPSVWMLFSNSFAKLGGSFLFWRIQFSFQMMVGNGGLIDLVTTKATDWSQVGCSCSWESANSAFHLLPFHWTATMFSSVLMSILFSSEYEGVWIRVWKRKKN